MGYKDKLGEGINVSGNFSFAQVSDATRRVVSAMGDKAIRVTSESGHGSIDLEIFDTGVRKVTGRSLFGAIAGAIAKEPDILARVAFEQSESGQCLVSVDIMDAATTSSSIMFIPAGTTVHGMATYRDFLDHMTAEFKVIDPNAAIIRR